MFGMKSYSKDNINECRARVESGLRAYGKHVGKTAKLEHRLFNGQVLLLDYMFVHQLTGMEGKDGNPLNEVRVLCNSILLNKGILQIDKPPEWPNSASSGIKLPPEKSVLKLKAGDEVKLKAPSRASRRRFSGNSKKYS